MRTKRCAVVVLLCAWGTGRMRSPDYLAAHRGTQPSCRTTTNVGGAYTATWTVRRVDERLYVLCMTARGYQRAEE